MASRRPNKGNLQDKYNLIEIANGFQ
jgi:hypothetical protein